MFQPYEIIDSADELSPYWLVPKLQSVNQKDSDWPISNLQFKNQKPGPELLGRLSNKNQKEGEPDFSRIGGLNQTNLRPVATGQIVTSADPDDVLVVYGLGSCVVICLYDPQKRVGGMLHSLLPNENRNGRDSTAHPAKFVDQGLPRLIDTLVALGAKPSRLVAQLCGGARMITAPGFNDPLNIGERNVKAARTALQAAGLKVLARATGGRTGRTVKFYIADGRVTVKTLGQEERVLVS